MGEKESLPRLEGVVEHYESIVKGWRKRYIVLENGVLGWRKMHDKGLRGTVNANQLVAAPDEDPHKFTLDAGANIVNIRVENSLVRDKWVAVFRKSAEILNGLLQKRKQRNVESGASRKIYPGMIEITQGQMNFEGADEQVEMHNEFITHLHNMQEKLEKFGKRLEKDPDLRAKDLLTDFLFEDKTTVSTKEITEGLSEWVSLGINVMSTENNLWRKFYQLDSASVTVKPFDKSTDLHVSGDMEDEDELTIAKDVEEDNDDDDDFFEPLSSFRGGDLHHHFDEEADALVATTAKSLRNINVVGHQRSKSAPPNLEDEFVRMRSKMPVQAEPRNAPGLFSIIKETVGKDLASIEFPIQMSEPLTMLQKAAEDLQYAELLDRAAACKDPGERMAMAAIFACTRYAATEDRFDKPFSSHKGETYELVMPMESGGFRLITESLKKAPAEYALSAESLKGKWKFYYALQIEQKFRGRNMELNGFGQLTIEFPEYGDRITYSLPNSMIYNIVMGKMWIDHFGTVDFVEHNSGRRCALQLMKTGWRTPLADVGKLEGTVQDKRGKPLVDIDGSWHRGLRYRVVKGGGYVNVWAPAPRVPANVSAGYLMNEFTLMLNDIDSSDGIDLIAPTDSRNRADLRLYEAGEFTKASEARAKINASMEQLNASAEQPKWFTKSKDKSTGETIMVPNDQYWKHREAGDWTCCFDNYVTGA